MFNKQFNSILTFSIIFSMLFVIGLHFEHEEDHDHETCQLCNNFNNMDNDAIAVKIVKVKHSIVKIELNYIFYSESLITTLSRAPPQYL